MLLRWLLAGLEIVLLASSTNVLADEAISFGAGFGALYNGFGVNIAKIQALDMKYVSLGCMGVGYSSNEGVSSNCGLGLGWIRKDLLSDNQKHGLGLHFGVTRNTDHDKDDTEAFAGISYMYFPHGSNLPGLTLGITPIVGRHNKATEGGVLLNIGYQF
ncbi:MAG: hypothetical protein PVI92_02380 [Chromatiales bacterium]|jgi:hypothetical protein